MTQRQRAQVRPLTGNVGASTGPWLPLALLLVGVSLALIGGLVIVQTIQQGRGPVLVGGNGSDAGTPSGKPTPPGSNPTPPGGAPVVANRGGQQSEPSGASDATPAPVPAPVIDPRPPPVFQPAAPGAATAPETAPSGVAAGATPAPTDGIAAGFAPEPPIATPARPAAAYSPLVPSLVVPDQDPRVDVAFAQLATDEDKVGQLLLLGWIGDSAEAARPVIRELRPGGIVFVQNTKSGAEATAMNATLRRIASEQGIVRPIAAIDHEGGNVQRIEDVRNLGSNWDFGLGRPTDLKACERGRNHAEQLLRLGFNMSLAPVLDVNDNPNNPVIGKRSYSDNPELVARLGAAYIRGLQGAGLASVGKHFPGHGNTGVDSHLALPILPQSVEQLARVELVPFRRAMEPDTDVAGIMSAHIVFPAVDPSGAPATLSEPVMTGLLRSRLGYRGLIVSDDMGAMKAITDNFAPGDAAARAVQAGVDMLIVSAELPRQRQYRDGLLDALRTGSLSRDRLDSAVRNVLRVKARFGILDGSSPPEIACS